MIKFFAILFFCALALASPCTDNCDALGAASTLYSGNVTWCSSTGVTYNTPRGAINDFTSAGCYVKQCGIALLYPGTCGCPNFCNALIGRGVCTSNNTCQCAPGWGGKDCSNIVCSANNTCSGHGTCKTQNKTGDICQCNNGWTSADCSVPVPSGLDERLPFGQIFPGNYYENDKYGDDQPVLNSSLVSSIRLTIAPDQLAYILDPVNLYNQSDIPAEFYFWNGYTDQSISINMRLHGSLSRVFNKKSYNLKFGKGNSFKKLKGLTLKATNFDRIVSFQMMWEFHRAMNSQTYRMGMAELWVNGVFYGMYTMLEKINDDFEESRYNVTQDTDMFKMALYDGQYLGNTSEPYQNLKTPIYSTPQNSIEKEEGSDDDWTRFVDFVKGINAPTAALRSAYLEEHFNIEGFLRSIALEAITLQFDGYSGTGNNWIITDSSDNNLPYWEWTAFDFDSPIDGLNLFQDAIARSLSTTPAQLQALIDAGVINLPPNLADYFLSPNPYKFVNRPTRPKPLLKAVFERPGANLTFTNNIRAFLRAVWVDGKDELLKRWDSYFTLASTMVYRDVFYTIDGSSIGLFVASAQLTRNLLINRFTYLQNLLGCENTVTWSQTLASSWSNGVQNFTEWSVTLRVGSEALYASEFSVTPSAGNTISNLWLADEVGNGVYAIPSWVYYNGILPANSNFYTFGYITSGNQKAAIRLTNEACSPPAGCTADVSAINRNSWQSDALYQQYDLEVENTSDKKLANFDVKITLAAGSTIISSYGLNEISFNVYRCNSYDLPSGSSLFPGCGFTVKTPQGITGTAYATTTLNSAICV